MQSPTEGQKSPESTGGHLPLSGEEVHQPWSGEFSPRRPGGQPGQVPLHSSQACGTVSSPVILIYKVAQENNFFVL